MFLPRPQTLLGILFLSFAAAARSSQDEGRVGELATLARDLAGRGEARQAIALVQSELTDDLAPAPRATLQFTLGWLSHQLADSDRANRMTHLEAAREWYRTGLESVPEQRSARANLALVEGDIALENGDREAALASWRSALALSPSLPGASDRFLTVLGSDGSALSAEAEALERSGHALLAQEVWARAIRATAPEAQGEPTLRWLLIAGEAGAFTRDSVTQFTGGSAALAELRLLARDPLRAPVPSWAASPLGAHAVSAAYRSLAAERRGFGAATAALDLIERGLQIAPDPALSARIPIRAELAVDELLLLLDEPGLDVSGARRQAAESRILAIDATELARGDGLERRAHAALGASFLAHGDRAAFGEGTAVHHLNLALASALAEDPTPALFAAGVSFDLGAAHARAGSAESAMNAYLDAALGFLALGENDRAQEALRRAETYDLALGGSERMRLVRERFGLAPLVPVDSGRRDPDDPGALELAPGRSPLAPGHTDGVLPRLFSMDFSGPTGANTFRPESWYVGASIGAAALSSSSGSIEGDLADLSHTVGVDLDDATTAYRIYGGYRLAQPFAIELGYADHGTIDSTVGPEPATGLPQFLADLADTHPATGAGPTLGIRALLVGNDTWSLGASAGVWFWQSDVEITTTTSKVTIDRDGTDPYYGIDLSWRPVDWGAIRLDLERYEIDAESTDVLSFGLSLDLDRLR